MLCVVCCLQRILEEYEQPFAITYVGVSLMVIFLPISVCKDWICGAVNKKLQDRNLFLEPSTGLYIPLRMNEVNPNSPQAFTIYPLTDMDDLNAAEEGNNNSFTSDEEFEDGFPVLENSHDLTSLEIIKYSLCLAPVWFITEV